MMRSQTEVCTRFAPLLKKEGSVFRKNVTSFIRKAIMGEHVVTAIQGVHETSYVVKDNTSWVVCGRAAGEHYVVSDTDFHKSYDITSAQPIPPHEDSDRLEGFLEYKSKRFIWARTVDEKDMIFFREDDNEDSTSAAAVSSEAYFVAPWGEPVRVEPGDILAMQYVPDEGAAPVEDEVYRIERKVFEFSYIHEANKGRKE